MQKCPKCMRDWDGRGCQACGYTIGTAAKVLAALPSSTLVNNRYILGNALGSSRQSIGYIAWDRQAGTRVLVEEFYPKTVVSRTANQTVEAHQGADLFSRAREMFLQAPRQGARPLNCVDAFFHGNTAMRVYAIDSAAKEDELMEAMLDRPILFRDSNGKALMTINALPMPDLPHIRKFSPSSSIARKRKRTNIKRFAMALATLVVLTAGAWYLYASRQPVSVTLIVPLFAEQKITLHHDDDNITNELKEPELKESAAQTFQSLTERIYRVDLKPGKYTISISQDGIDMARLQETEFQVFALQPADITANLLEPFAQVTAGADDENAQKAIERLKALGYLDPEESSIVYGIAAQEAYADFIQENGKGAFLKDDSKNIYLDGFELLLSQQAKSIPYVQAGSGGERADKAVDRLKVLHYLSGSHDSFDLEVADAYAAFLRENQLVIEPEDEKGISAANWEKLSAKSAKPNPPLVALGQKDENAAKAVNRLQELYYLSGDHSASVFDKEALDAYQEFLKANGFDLGDQEGIYQEDWDLLNNPKFSAKVTPTPVPPEAYWSDGYFIYATLGEEKGAQRQSLVFTGPQEETKTADKVNNPLFDIQGSKIAGAHIAVPKHVPDRRVSYFDTFAKQIEKELWPVTINIVRPELPDGLLLTKVNGSQDGASAYLPVKHNVIRLLLSEGEYRLDAVIGNEPAQQQIFAHLPSLEKIPETLIVGVEMDARPFQFNPDWNAISYYLDNNMLPLENDRLIYKIGETYYQNGNPIDDDRVKNLLANNEPILIKGEDREASKPLVLMDTYLAQSGDVDAYADILSGKLPPISAPKFKVKSLSLDMETISFGYKEGKVGIHLPAGDYELEIEDTQKIFSTQNPIEFSVSQAGGRITLPVPDAGVICNLLHITPYKLGEAETKLNPELVMGDELKKALIQDLSGELHTVDLTGALDEDLLKFYQESNLLFIEDTWGQTIALGNASTVSLGKGDYKLKVGSFSSKERSWSKEFTLPGKGTQFDEGVKAEIRTEYEKSIAVLWMCCAEIMMKPTTPMDAASTAEPTTEPAEAPDLRDAVPTVEPAVISDPIEVSTEAQQSISPKVYKVLTKAGWLDGDNWPQNKLERFFNNVERKKSMTSHMLRFIDPTGTGIKAVNFQLDDLEKRDTFDMDSHTGSTIRLEMYVPAELAAFSYTITPVLNDGTGTATKFKAIRGEDLIIIAISGSSIVNKISSDKNIEYEVPKGASCKFYRNAITEDEPPVSEYVYIPDADQVSDILLLPAVDLWLEINDTIPVRFTLNNDGTINIVKEKDNVHKMQVSSTPTMTPSPAPAQTPEQPEPSVSSTNPYSEVTPTPEVLVAMTDEDAQMSEPKIDSAPKMKDEGEDDSLETDRDVEKDNANESVNELLEIYKQLTDKSYKDKGEEKILKDKKEHILHDIVSDSVKYYAVLLDIACRRAENTSNTEEEDKRFQAVMNDIIAANKQSKSAEEERFLQIASMMAKMDHEEKDDLRTYFIALEEAAEDLDFHP